MLLPDPPPRRVISSDSKHDASPRSTGVWDIWTIPGNLGSLRAPVKGLRRKHRSSLTAVPGYTAFPAQPRKYGGLGIKLEGT
jgi:hypothetical protein